MSQVSSPRAHGAETCGERPGFLTGVNLWAKGSALKARWAIKDKEAFEKLLKDLTQFNQSLYDLHSLDISRAITRDALASLISSTDMNTLESLSALGTGDPVGKGTQSAGSPPRGPAGRALFPCSVSAAASIAHGIRNDDFRFHRRAHSPVDCLKLHVDPYELKEDQQPSEPSGDAQGPWPRTRRSHNVATGNSPRDGTIGMEMR